MRLADNPAALCAEIQAIVGVLAKELKSMENKVKRTAAVVPVASEKDKLFVRPELL